MSEFKRQQRFFLILCFFYLSAIALAYSPIKSVLTNPRIDLFYTHIPIIPVISAFLFFRKRKFLFTEPAPALLTGILISLAGLFLYLLIILSKLQTEGSISLAVISTIIFWSGTYIALYGLKSFQMAIFPVGFLLLAVPLPETIMNWLVNEIARLSVHITDIVFSLIGTPFVRQGIDIYLPGYILVVGPECAGWRSSIALVIISLLAGHLFLKEFKHKFLLVAAAIPLIIIKNGLRIVALYLLAYFINEKFMEPGFIHRSVGYVMFIIILIVMGLLLWLLETREKKKGSAREID